MPNSTYKPLKDPPGFFDRLLAHPEEAGLAAFNIVVSVALAISPWFTSSQSLAQLPHLFVILLSVLFGLGGLSALCGVFWKGHVVSHGWAAERIGLLLSAGGWFAYGAIVMVSFPTSLISYCLVFMLSSINLLRFWALVRLEKVTRQTLRNLAQEN